MPGAKITAKNNATSMARTAQTYARFTPEIVDNFPIGMQSRRLVNLMLTLGAVTQRSGGGGAARFWSYLLQNHRTNGNSAEGGPIGRFPETNSHDSTLNCSTGSNRVFAAAIR
jgi:hypothetical protein